MFSLINIMEIINKTKTQIQILNQRFFLILENFVPHYISHLQNPQNETSAAEMDHINSVITQIDSDGFTLKNEMQVEIEKSQAVARNLSIEIEKLQTENKVLKTKTTNLERTTLTSEGLFDDELDWYRKQIKIIVIMLIGVIISTIFFHSLKLDIKNSIIAILMVIIGGVLIEGVIMTIVDKIKGV